MVNPVCSLMIHLQTTVCPSVSRTFDASRWSLQLTFIQIGHNKEQVLFIIKRYIFSCTVTCKLTVLQPERVTRREEKVKDRIKERGQRGERLACIDV